MKTVYATAAEGTGPITFRGSVGDGPSRLYTVDRATYRAWMSEQIGVAAMLAKATSQPDDGRSNVAHMDIGEDD